MINFTHSLILPNLFALFSVATANLRYEVIDRAIFTWFCQARGYKIPLSGSVIREKALQLAAITNPDTEFTASIGWFTSFTKRHNLSLNILCGEGSTATQETVELWKSRVIEKCSGYESRNIFNCDETALFYKQLPKKSYTMHGDTNVGSKSSKLRLTVLLLSNLIGEKESPIIIGHAKRPRCFGRIDVERAHNIIWRSNRNAWMTSTVFHEFLTKFDRKMRLQQRKVLLFLDNASCHTDADLTNVQLEFLPPNTTSIFQPMDQGIIQSFKLYYRKYLLHHVIASIDHSVDIRNIDVEPIPTITIMDALNWISAAWYQVKPETITKCFIKAGFPSNDPTNSEQELESELINLLPVDMHDGFINCDNSIGM